MSATAHPGTDPIPASLSGIRVAALKVAKASAIDLYMIGEDGQPTFYRSRDYRVSTEDFQRLQEKGVHTLYVSSEVFDRLSAELRANLTETLASDEFTPTERFQLLQFAVESEVSNAFRRVNADEAVSKSQEMGQHLVDLLKGSQALPQELFRVMKHDFATFSHVVNVSSYCVLLAQELGISDKLQLQHLAVGGMLHDIGKRKIPATILQKPGRLTDQEFDVIKEHPATGYVELCERDDVTFSQLMMVYQHHERIDGTGYPVGCPGEEIHEWARICAVVDIFDAITGERPYRKRMSKNEALEVLNRMAGKHLDSEMVRCWTRAMGEH